MELLLNSIDYDEARSRDGYSYGGELCITVHDEFFPAEHWYDSVYADLKNWLPRLISFGMNHADTCDLSFMDGPYAVRLSRLSDGIVDAVFLRHQIVADTAADIDVRALLKSVLSCCRKYDRFLYENGKPSQFQEEIRTLMHILYL